MPTGQSTSWQPSLSPTTIATFSSSAKIHQKPDKIPNFTPQLSSLFWGLPRWTELDKKYPFQPALQFHRNWQDLSCSAREKEIGNFSPLTWRGALFHLGIFASCHSCARKETISSLSSLKVAAQEAYCVPDDLELVWWLAVLATPTLELKLMKNVEKWKLVDRPSSKGKSVCPLSRTWQYFWSRVVFARHDSPHIWKVANFYAPPCSCPCLPIFLCKPKLAKRCI